MLGTGRGCRAWLTLAAMACGCSGGTVTGTARIIKGGAGDTSQARITGISAAAEGEWQISPNAIRFELTRVDFTAPDGTGLSSAALTDCAVEYHYDDASGSEILACPFEIEAGAIGGMRIYVKNRYGVLVDDPVNQLYTDADGLTGTEPAGGATYYEYTTDESINGEDLSYETPPVLSQELADGDTITVSIIADMNHSMSAAVLAGEPSFTNVGRPGTLTAVPGTGGHSVLYTVAGTAQNVNVDALPDGVTLVRIAYIDDEPVVLEAQGPGACGTGSGEAVATDTGGYLGRDANGVIAWAFAAEETSAPGDYGGYARMAEAATRGDTITLECVNTTAVPAPTTGSTYASGAPEIASPDASTVLTLAAD